MLISGDGDRLEDKSIVSAEKAVSVELLPPGATERVGAVIELTLLLANELECKLMVCTVILLTVVEIGCSVDVLLLEILMDGAAL